MADRTVLAKLVLDIAGYAPAAVEASKSTSALATAQKETAAAAKESAVAQRDAAAASKDAAATASAAAKAVSAAEKEAAAAAKEAASAEVLAAKATTDAERTEAEAVAKTAAEQSAAAEEAVTAARAKAEAAAQNAASAKASAAEAANEARAQRDLAAATKEAAASEATSAKETEAAAAKRSEAYKSSGTAMTTMAVGGAAAIGLMVKSAGDFNSATQHLVTDAGESQANLAMVQAGILKTATATGTASSALVDAMYHIESAGFHGADGLKMLTTAAEGAKVGNADLGTVAKTLTGTMNSYNMAGDQSVTMMNQLIATVGAGDMKMNDLAGSLGNVTPIAASAGLSFAEVGGAIATMTSQNMSADRSTQDLANTINALQKPNNVAVQQMQQLGLSSNDVSMNLGKRGLTGTLELLTAAVANHTQNGQVFIDTLKSSQNAAADADVMLKQLPASIQDISKQLLDGSITAAEYNKGIAGLSAPQQHLAKQFEALAKSSGSFNDLLKSGKPEAETFNAAMSNMLGGATGLNTSLMLTGSRMVTFKDNTEKIADAANKSGAQVNDWDKIQGTFNQKIDVAKASLGAMGIAIGTTLLPSIAAMAGWVTSIVTPIAAWVDKHQTLTAVVLGSATALAALVLAIKLAMKTADLVKSSIEGVSTAIKFFSKDAEVATAKTEAMGAANAAAAAETDVASASTSGLVGKLGGAVPVMGAVAVGAWALGEKLGQMAGVGDHTGQSITDLTNKLLDMSQGSTGSTKNMQTLVVQLADMGKKLHEVDSGNSVAVQGMKDLDKSVADLVTSGHADQAAASFKQMQDALVAQGYSLGYIHDQLFPQYNKALADTALNQRESKLTTDGATKSLDANAAAATGAANATDAVAASNAAAAQTGNQQAAATKDQTAAQNEHIAAVRLLNDAVNAKKDADIGETTAVKAKTSATSSDTTVTNAATTAKHAQTSADKGATTAARDAGKAVNDHAKANDANAKAAKAAADASKANADASATDAQKKSAAAAATRDAAAASRASSAATAADTRASDASATASDKAGRAHDAAAKAADAKSKAADKSAKASANEAAAQKAAAEAAADAAFNHQIGVTALDAYAKAAADTSHASDTLSDAVISEVTAMKSAKDKAGALKDALDSLNGVHISAGKASVDYQQHIADLTKAFRENGSTLDITTDAGRKNMNQIYDTATAAAQLATSYYEETGNLDGANKMMATSRDEFDKVLTKAGLTKQQIDDFNKSLMNIPAVKPIALSVDDSAARQSINKLRQDAGQPLIMFGGARAMATGGLVTGAGTGTSDSVPVMASAGEWIVPADAAQAFGYENLAHITSMGHGSIVKPHVIASVGGTTPQSSGPAGAALHIENFHAGGESPQQIADHLVWLGHARGGQA